MMVEIANRDYKKLLLDEAPPVFNISNSFEPITIYELAKLIGSYLNVSVRKGPANSNLYFAPKLVKVYPERFLKIFPKYKFLTIREGIKKVCNEAQKNFSITMNQ